MTNPEHLDIPSILRTINSNPDEDTVHRLTTLLIQCVTGADASILDDSTIPDILKHLPSHQTMKHLVSQGLNVSLGLNHKHDELVYIFTDLNTNSRIHRSYPITKDYDLVAMAPYTNMSIH